MPETFSPDFLRALWDVRTMPKQNRLNRSAAVQRGKLDLASAEGDDGSLSNQSRPSPD